MGYNWPILPNLSVNLEFLSQSCVLKVSYVSVDIFSRRVSHLFFYDRVRRSVLKWDEPSRLTERMRSCSDELPHFVDLPTFCFRSLLIRSYCYFIVDSETMTHKTIYCSVRSSFKATVQPQVSDIYLALSNTSANIFNSYNKFALFNLWTVTFYWIVKERQDRLHPDIAFGRLATWQTCKVGSMSWQKLLCGSSPYTSTWLHGGVFRCIA